MDYVECAVLDILLDRGFTVSRAGYYLFAVNDQTRLAVCIIDGDDGTVQRFMADTTGFDGRRVIATGDSIPGYLKYSFGDDLFLWDRRALEAETGRRLDPDTGRGGLDEERVRELVGEDVADDEGAIYL